MLLGMFVVMALALMATAADKDSGSEKEVTLKGTIACSKCTFKEPAVEGKCNIAIKVKEKDKDVIYYFDADAHKKWMGGGGDVNFCTKSLPGSVTGTVSEKDGKKWIKVTKLEHDKE
jgi:hypothetical protein